MFNMNFTGQKIAELRKRKDMTQLELADKMNISFQAVSNWERGNSMPDISKLPELAEIFEVSVDEIVGAASPLLTSLVGGKVQEHLKENAVSAEELMEIAPIMKPSQVSNVFENANPPFSFSDIEGILPYLSAELIDNIAQKAADANESITRLAPYVSESKLNEIALQGYKKSGLASLRELFPFIGDDILIEIAENEYAARGFKSFECIAPYLDSECLNKLAKQAIEKDGIKALSPIAPYLDKNMLSEFVKEKYL